MDIQQTAVNGLKRARSIILDDLRALPEEAYDKSFGPSVRTVSDIIYEINLVNDHMCLGLRGEEQFAWPDEGFIRAPADFKGKDHVMAAFDASMQKAIETAESFSTEQWDESMKTENGDRTRFQQAQFMVLHMWYHSGQLNFIQTLLGDEGWHWS